MKVVAEPAFWPQGLLFDEMHILGTPHRPCRGDTFAGERPLQHGAGSWIPPAAAHAWKSYAGIHSLSVGETPSVTEAAFYSLGCGSLALGKKISVTEQLAVLCHG